MVSIKKPLVSIARRSKNPLKTARLFIKEKLDWIDYPTILPYRGFGNENEFTIKGHLLESKALARPEEQNSRFNNMLAMLKRFESDELPGLQIKGQFYGQELITRTEEDGSFEFTFHLKEEIPHDKIWHQVHLELLEKIRDDQDEVTAKGEVMLSSKGSDFGIISDIDDTILISHSTNTLKKLRLMLFKNASTRMPFEGAAGFYRALHRCSNPGYFNPLFFVSSSEWNLYDLLVDFFKENNIPKSPLLLKTLKTSLKSLLMSGGGQHNHKFDKIRHILNAYYYLDFILIGDSGQHDPEIYSRIVEEFPGRIKTIYIRNVKKSKRRIGQVEKIAQTLKEKYNTPMLLVKDSEDAAYHAVENGFIEKDQISDIILEKEKDKAAQSSLIK